MKGYMRDEKGKYKKIPFLNSNFSGLKLLLGIAILGATLNYLYTPVELVSPISSLPVVHAVEPTPQPTTEPRTPKEKILHAWGPVEGPMAVKVAFCESSLNPEAKHKNSTASGLFQIIRGTWKGYKCEGDPFNADDNIACAYKIYQANGWDSTASWSASAPCWKGAK